MFKYKLILILTILILLPFSTCIAAEIKISYGWSNNPDETEAVNEAVAMMYKEIDNPSLIILLSESSYENDDIIARKLYELTNGARIFGLEGSYAVFTNDGVHVGEKGSIAILGVKAPSWSVGVGAKDMSAAKSPMQIKEMAMDAIKEAVNDAGRTLDDRPDLVLVAPTKLKAILKSFGTYIALLIYKK